MHRIITKKWVEVHDQSRDANDRYKLNKPTRFKTSMLRSDLCDFSDAYIVVKGDITLMKAENRYFIDVRNRFLAFKNNAPFSNCISKINNVLINKAEDLHIVMPMYNLLECSKNYSKTTGSLWNYYKDEPNNPPPNNYNADSITNFVSFKYKTSITGKTSNINLENGANTEQGNAKIKKKLDIVVSLKHSNNVCSNILKHSSIPLIEVSLILTWSENCVLTDIKRRIRRGARVAIKAPTNATFKITDTKLYVLVVTLSTENDKTLLEQLKIGFKRTIKWNKYRSERLIRQKLTTYII